MILENTICFEHFYDNEPFAYVGLVDPRKVK
jgi:hypothetical protein